MAVVVQYFSAPTVLFILACNATLAPLSMLEPSSTVPHMPPGTTSVRLAVVALATCTLVVLDPRSLSEAMMSYQPDARYKS